MAISVHLLLRDILTALDVPRSMQNVWALGAQRQAEGGEARWNLFNTTRKLGNCTPYNTLEGGLHVWNYATRADGVNATVATFRQSNFAYLLSALKRGNSAVNYWQVLITPPTPPPGVRYDKWGTTPPGGLTIAQWLADVDRNWMAYLLSPVPGS